MNAHLARRRALAIAAVGCVALTVGACSQQTRYAQKPQPTVMLANFDSCQQALEGFKNAANGAVGPDGLPDGSRDANLRTQEDSASDSKSAPDANSPQSEGAQKPEEHSSTNNQETGIDEPDAVKTDGRRIYTLSDGVLRIVDATERSFLGSLDLAPDEERLTPTQILISEDRALIVMEGPMTLREPSPRIAPDIPSQQGSKVVLVELDESPSILSSLSIEGSYVDARQIGDTVRLVTRSSPRLDFRENEPGQGPYGTGKAIENNREIINASHIQQWLPRFIVEEQGREEQKQVPCGNISHPTDYSGSTMLSVFTLGFNKLEGNEPVTIAADGSTVYSSENTLYVAGQNFHTMKPTEGTTIDEHTLRTELYAFDIAGKKQPQHVASGSVPGALLNQYSISEHDKHVRIVTTNVDGSVTCCDDEAQTESTVYVLKRTGQDLDIVGQVGGLGKSEQIYAVRFIGTMGYVVTFREMDPLYVIDLSEPTAPQVQGELKITGYSAYLHPAGKDQLIGVGQEASEKGQREGLQVSLFDVSDPASPDRLDQYHLTDSSSDAEYDPHAFLYWEKEGLLAVPFTRSMSAPSGTDSEVAPREPNPDVPDSGVVVLKVGKDKLSELGTIHHPANSTYNSEISRSLIVGDTLWTVSRTGLMATNIEDVNSPGTWIEY